MKKTLAIIMAVIIAVFAFSTESATGTGSDFQYTYNEVDGGIRIDRVSGKLSSTFEIPGEIDGKTVIAIGDNPCMFINYYDVEKVIIPDSVKKIGNFAFANFHIREIELPAGLEVIGNHAFEGSMLTKITIPNGVKKRQATTLLVNTQNLQALQFPTVQKSSDMQFFPDVQALKPLLSVLFTLFRTLHSMSAEICRMWIWMNISPKLKTMLFHFAIH